MSAQILNLVKGQSRPDNLESQGMCIKPHFFPNPVFGIWRALPSIGTVGGPGGIRGWRLPTDNSLYTG
jgi:hypothetical protein